MDGPSDYQSKIFTLARDYFDAHESEVFIPGTTYIPPSGKVLNADDLCALFESCLDLHLTGGRFSQEFEESLANIMQSHSASLVTSGSAANLLAFGSLFSNHLKDRAIPVGSEIITVAAGFPTTIAPIVQYGCVPVFVDIDLRTGNIDTENLEEAITSKTRAIVLAHTLGNPFDLGTVVDLCKQYNLYLIEDCCDAFGSTYDDKIVGQFGDMSTLSFYPAHHITTGEGGAVMASNKNLSRIITSMRDWGRDCWCPPAVQNTCNNRFGWQLGDLPIGYDHKYTYSHLGYNLKATEMQAALGLSQLKKLRQFIKDRRTNWQGLKDGFLKAGLEEFFHLPEATKRSDPSWFGFLITLRDGLAFDRRSLTVELEKAGVGTRLLFAGNITRQPAFDSVKHRSIGDLSSTDKVMRDGLWIGVWPGIDLSRREYMIHAMSDVVRKLNS